MRALLLALVVVLTVLAPSGHAAGRPKTDPRLDRGTCTMLGRAWVQDACSTRRCLREKDFIRTAPNAEVCVRNGQAGRRYGTFVEERRCTALHRRWVSEINVCVSDPRRWREVVERAPSCSPPYTSYVMIWETEGYYDECVRPQRAEELRRIATRRGEPLRKVAGERSRTLCSFRDGMIWRNGRCRPSPPQDFPGAEGTLQIGDSVTWRGLDELAGRRPDWRIDGYPGRNVKQLPIRIERYLAWNPAPSTMVVALGTNPGRGWTKEDYAAAVSGLPESTVIAWVLPYRALKKQNQTVVTKTARYAGWMRELAAERPRSCVVDWRRKAERNPDLLIDGTHQTPRGERVWARMVDQRVAECEI